MLIKRAVVVPVTPLPPPAVFAASLTHLQLTILQWLADGKLTKEVAEIMVMTENAVQVNLFRAMNRTGTATRVGVVAFALRRGLIK